MNFNSERVEKKKTTREKKHTHNNFYKLTSKERYVCNMRQRSMLPMCAPPHNLIEDIRSLAITHKTTAVHSAHRWWPSISIPISCECVSVRVVKLIFLLFFSLYLTLATIFFHLASTCNLTHIIRMKLNAIILFQSILISGYELLASHKCGLCCAFFSCVFSHFFNWNMRMCSIKLKLSTTICVHIATRFQFGNIH